VGKQATGFLLDVNALGGIGGQRTSLSLCNSRGGNAYAGSEVYVVCSDEGTIDEVQVGAGASLSRGWVWRSPTGAAGSPTLADGWLWTVDPSASVLYAVDPGSGTTHAALALHTGTPTPFATPAPAGSLVVVAGSQAVEAFG
jgi:hypothetical protein